MGHLTLQSMFVRDAEGMIDNTTPRAVDAWLEAVDRVRPRERGSLHACARRPARATLQAVPAAVLEAIAARVAELGIPRARRGARGLAHPAISERREIPAPPSEKSHAHARRKPGDSTRLPPSGGSTRPQSGGHAPCEEGRGASN